MSSSSNSLKKSIIMEFSEVWKNIRQQKFTLGFLIAIICVSLVIFGNVIYLISINLWLQVFPKDSLTHNSGQIAILLFLAITLEVAYVVLMGIFVAIFGAREMWHTLTDTNRIGHPLYRLFLLFASGFTNALSGLFAVYAMLYTPEFLQAVFLCFIPFSSQMWTMILIPEERKRDYCSFFLIASAVFLVAGILFSSLSVFINANVSGAPISISWSLIYILSDVVFGLWCVTQRLYLDSLILKDEEEVNKNKNDNGTEVIELANRKSGNPSEDLKSQEKTILLVEKRSWARQSVAANSDKLVLLVGGLFFQALISFLVFPVDALPWFGTSTSVSESWQGFSQSFNFIFQSWYNMRYGMLLSLGILMSFAGCSYLNEQSPTLASVVLQIAAPVTSLVLIIFPQWNVYQESGHPVQKSIGLALLFFSVIFYHIWDQRSVKNLLLYAQEKRDRLTNKN